MTQELETAYEAAKAADAKFQAEVIRQFGTQNAGDMRYRNSMHDERTKAARDEFQTAAAELLRLQRVS